MPQHLVLQVGFEPGHLGVALGEHEPDLPIVEGDQPIVRLARWPSSTIDRHHVGHHRRRQVRDARGVDTGEERELRRYRARLHRHRRHRPGPLLGLERLTLGLAVDERRHASDAGGEYEHRQYDSDDSGGHALQRRLTRSRTFDRPEIIAVRPSARPPVRADGSCRVRSACRSRTRSRPGAEPVVYRCRSGTRKHRRPHRPRGAAGGASAFPRPGFGPAAPKTAAKEPPDRPGGSRGPASLFEDEDRVLIMIPPHGGRAGDERSTGSRRRGRRLDGTTLRYVA